MAGLGDHTEPVNERMGDKLRWAAEVLLFGLAVLDAWLAIEPEWSLSTVAVSVGVLALAVRRRHPYVAFVLTLPMLALSYAVVAVLITLYGVARHTRDRRVLALCSTAVAIGAVPWPGKVDMVSGPSIMVDVIYALMMGAASCISRASWARSLASVVWATRRRSWSCASLISFMRNMSWPRNTGAAAVIAA